MIKKIKDWWFAYKEKNQQEAIKRLRESFYIQEKNGVIYIMHNDVATWKIESNATSKSVICFLDKIRNIAVENAYGNGDEKGIDCCEDEPKLTPINKPINKPINTDYTISFLYEKQGVIEGKDNNDFCVIK